jgi:Ni,Fe-hydrogenase III small subunit/NAD-dependent dihydropyrimidine dehydrogenase PreA subunit
MLNILRARLQQKYRTMPFPSPSTTPVDRCKGLPVCDFSGCAESCGGCKNVCPTQALRRENGKVRLDLGSCLFCGACEKSCPSGAVKFTNEYRCASRTREDLLYAGGQYPRAAALQKKIRGLFGRSLKLRQVSAAGCNACEADTNVLGTLGYDLGRFGIQFVASPRHADGLFITGPVSKNMRLALQKTYEAVAAPKLVILCGACAISGGIFQGHEQVNNGAADLLPVDLFIPGCPPHPLTILDGLLRLLGRIE